MKKSKLSNKDLDRAAGGGDVTITGVKQLPDGTLAFDTDNLNIKDSDPNDSIQVIESPDDGHILFSFSNTSEIDENGNVKSS